MNFTVDVHHSVGEDVLKRETIDSLQANWIDSKLLYAAPRQTELWREVFLRHSPVHTNPEFARIYREAFARVAERVSPGQIHLVGLGCGTGKKEAEFCVQLVQRGFNVYFSAVDVSRDLVLESARKLSEAGARLEKSVACDLAQADFLAGWLEHAAGDLPRMSTFFGLVPNLAPSVVTRLFRSILRPGDVVLVSAHLAPLGDDGDLAAAMRSVLPQYDNPETLAWLSAALEEWGLREMVDAPEMNIGEVEGVPAFVAGARWKSSQPFERSGHRFTPNPDEPLQLFHSLRYTPELFKKLLGDAGFKLDLLEMTACREEAIWAVQL